MVVEKEHGGRIELQCFLHDDPRVNRRAIDDVLKQLGNLDNPVPVAEEKTSKYLVLALSEPDSQISASFL